METTKRCPFCAEEILAAAIKCKHCGSDFNASAGTAVKRRPLVRAPFLILGAAIIGPFILLVALAPSSQELQEKAAADAMPPPPRSVMKLTAAELYSGYEANEVAMDQLIGKQAIEITGTIKAIDKDFADHASMKLDAGGLISRVRLLFPDSQKGAIARVRTGLGITVRCDSVKRILGDPVADDCVLASPSN